MGTTPEIIGRSNGRLLVVRDGQIVAGYTVGPWRSYIYPVLTPRGFPLTEESPVDHPHHNSIWMGQDELDGHNLWLTKPGCGRVEGTCTQAIEGASAVFCEINHWLSPTGEPLLREERTTRITPAPAGEMCHTIDIESVRQPAGTHPVLLGQTKEAGLGIRMLQQLDGEDNGVIEDSVGRQGEAATFDQDADWIDYWGTMAGQRLGLAMLPHPTTQRHPWFTRDYGIVVWNPLRHQQHITLHPGDALRCRVRLLAHDGDSHEARIAAHYAAFSGQMQKA